jgi:serine/threonine-protein kinase
MTTTPPANELVEVVDSIEERYALGDVLGEGGMGQVFAARDTLLGIDVAVKTLHTSHLGSPSVILAFEREATICARMVSPHILKVLAVGTTRAGTPSIVYEHLDGETLGQRLARSNWLSLSETIEIVKQTSHALTHAHAMGVVHCDVKPDNLFLTRDEAGHMLVKLLDFGIAETADGRGHYAQRELRGTPEYMAPELLLATHQLDVQADLYAVGVVVFECLTGRCPFEGDLAQVLTLLRSGVRASFAEHRPDLGDTMNDWISHALEADPFWRFASAKVLSDSLACASAADVAQGSRVERMLVLEAA